jgi:CarD family transcriptional regulator
MFKIGECVIHANHGVCKIDSIENISYDGKSEAYYVLHPVFGNQNNFVLKIPVSNENYLDSLISESDISEIIKKIILSKDYWNDNPMKRTLEYKTMFQNKDFVKLGVLIRSINNRKNDNKKLSATDKKIFENAKVIFYGICSVVLKMPYDQVNDFYFGKIYKEQ